jgi:hypothetical protein
MISKVILMLYESFPFATPSSSNPSPPLPSRRLVTSSPTVPLITPPYSSSAQDTLETTIVPRVAPMSPPVPDVTLVSLPALAPPPAPCPGILACARRGSSVPARALCGCDIPAHTWHGPNTSAWRGQGALGRAMLRPGPTGLSMAAIGPLVGTVLCWLPVYHLVVMARDPRSAPDRDPSCC